MPLNLRQQYTGYSNADLLRIITSKGDYRPDAMEAAQRELDTRNLSTPEFDEAMEEIEEDNGHSKRAHPAFKYYDSVFTFLKGFLGGLFSKRDN